MAGDEEEEEEASANPTSTTRTIWDDTATEFGNHPLLQVAIQLVKENIENCHYSGDGVDDGEEAVEEYKRVLLSLPGRFGTEPMEGNLFGLTDANRGILFNADFVQQGTSYVRTLLGNPAQKPQDLREDFNVLTFIAILQETLEHQLGHWKFHVEGMKSLPGNSKPDKALKALTPDRLRFESGYAVQKRIRGDNFENEDRNGCRLLDLHNAVGNFPLQPKFVAGETETRQAINLTMTTSLKILDKEEIIKHMEYPRISSCTPPAKKRKREGGKPDDGPSDNEGGGGGGGGVGGRSTRNPRSWQESISAFLTPAVEKAAQLWEKETLSQCETSLDGKDARLTKPIRRDEAARMHNEAELMKCQFDVTFCNSEREEKSEFKTNEEIHITLKVTNTTKGTVFVKIAAGKYFGRVGIYVLIDGLEKGRVHMSRVSELKLAPGESYTFFRTLTKPEKDEDVHFATPKPGTYKAYVAYKYVLRQRSFEFSVLPASASAPAPSQNSS